MLTESQLILQRSLALEYTESLTDQALSYLDGRGISEKIAANKWLGTVANNNPGHENYQGWLSIPYVVATGNVVGFKFRRIDEGLPKYGAPLGQKSHLYNVTDINKQSPVIAICEGELDAIVLSEICDIPAVGCPGVSSWKKHYGKLFQGFEKVLIVGDNDNKEDGSNPGQDFARRVAQEIAHSQVILLPAGMDINSFYLAEGADAVRERLGIQWKKTA